MKLYERFADKNYHTSIATTFGIDFDAYENIVLPRLRGAGCRNNILIPDARMLSHALAGASVLPRHAGRLYTVNGASARGAFHPKLFLQFGRKGGRLILGSANLTASGLAGNLELVGMIACGDEDSGEQRLIAQAWTYASRFIDTDLQALSGQRDWMLRRTPWLRQAAAEPGSVELADGTMAALLTTGQTSGIAPQFANLIDEPISRLIVISPYWDMALQALSHLIERISPAKTALLIDPDAAAFPKNALSGFPNLQLYHRGGFGKDRFIHAKTVIAQGQNADHILIGSANCTVAALGTQSYAGENEEVCFYRRFPPDGILDALGLSALLTDDQRIDPDDLEEPELAEDLPLDYLAARAPGLFECRIDVLSWRPTRSLDLENCKITLLDQRGDLIACALSPLPADGQTRRYHISGTDMRPSFAMVTFADGRDSLPAIVTLVDHLRVVIRETQSRKVENALRDLDTESEAQLSLLEVLDVLRKLDSDDAAAKNSISVAKRRKADVEPDLVQHRVLSYEQFVAGRRPRTAQSQPVHNSLAGSESSLVRGFLNRILGMTADAPVDDDDGDLTSAFDLGDETDNAQAAMEFGQEFGVKRKEPTPAEQEEEEARKRKAAQRKATRDQILTAAVLFSERIKERQSSGALDNHDVLRLRALLMIICAASWSGMKNAPAPSSIQVLSGEGDLQSWPFVMGRLLFPIFGGRDPAIRHLYLNSEHDQIPDDITECWATCYWCLQACLAAPATGKAKLRIGQFLNPLTSLAYQLTLPSSNELLSDDVLTIMDALSKRYAERMGVVPAVISKGHRAVVEELFAKQSEAASRFPRNTGRV